ncbi:MAG: PIG-L family deacetylase [Candidatus Binatia bacterium]
MVPLLLAGAVFGSPVIAASSPSDAVADGLAGRPSGRLASQPDAGALALAVARLRVVGSVLYVAAHPDDENTRLLAWLVGERKLRTAYLSLTRGDGGQNLIGSEQGEMFGLLRTAELLEARKLDGAEQFFTRAVDFGYSKSTDESLRLWRYPEVLTDVVRAMRRFRPDVVIARFSAADAKTHGHHSASARLAHEAFEAAADPARFRAELPGLEPWRAARLLWNKSTWSKPADADWSADLPTDVGGYNPLLGASYGEIAGRSRSMHKSQGFGAEQQRGPILEYFEVLEGQRPPVDFLAGIDFTWKRAGGDDELIAVLERASATLRPEAPHEIIPLLLDARRRIRALPDSHHKSFKLAELDEVVAACAGLWLEATADGYVRAPGEEVEVTATAIDRSPFPMELVSVAFGGAAFEPGDASSGAAKKGGALAPNQPVVVRHRVKIAANADYTTPPWLREDADGALYRLPRLDLIGHPSSPAALEVVFELKVGEETLRFTRDVDFKWVDPVVGERRRPLEIHPAVTLTLDRRVLVFAGPEPRDVRVVAKAGAASVSGRLRLEVPQGWRVEPAGAALALPEREAEEVFAFRVWPPEVATKTPGTLRAVADVSGRELSQGLARIEYPHIPIQTLFPAAEARLVPVDLVRGIDRIGYIPGAGDDVAASLAEVGYGVTVLDEAALANANLAGLDAIVVGVRAHNVNPRLRFHHARLMAWVEGGGTLVTQYNAVNRISDVAGPIGPFPFEITRDRVTDESAPVRFDDPSHAVLHHPNEITAADFDGWVQERGLYFATNPDPRYRAPIAFHDPGEGWTSGGVLVAAHGKGRFVYTGLSFFRQLPAGVPGAYRLFANLLAPGSDVVAPGGAAPSSAPAAGKRIERTDDQSGVRN